MYVELKTGFDDNGPASISRVRFSKTGQTLYYRDRQLQRVRGVLGNHCDVASGEEFWVSGVKNDGADRHWAGSGNVEIDEDVRAEYLSMRAGELRLEIRGEPERGSTDRRHAGRRRSRMDNRSN